MWTEGGPIDVELKLIEVRRQNLNLLKNLRNNKLLLFIDGEINGHRFALDENVESGEENLLNECGKKKLVFPIYFCV